MITYIKIEIDKSTDYRQLEKTSFDMPVVLKELHDLINEKAMFLKFNSNKSIEFILTEKYINILNNIENIIKKHKVKINIIKINYEEV